MTKKSKKGFTLIELVIVIAVIAILAAVLIPTFGNIITKSKESAAMQKATAAKTAFTAETVADLGQIQYFVLSDEMWFEVTTTNALVKIGSTDSTYSKVVSDTGTTYYELTNANISDLGTAKIYVLVQTGTDTSRNTFIQTFKAGETAVGTKALTLTSKS